MRFKYIREMPGRVKAYEGHTVATGEVLEFSPAFAAKALRSSDWEVVSDDAAPSEPDPGWILDIDEPVPTDLEPQPAPSVKRKRGRPRKHPLPV